MVEERDRLLHALSVLTEDRQSVNSQGMTNAQRLRIAKARAKSKRKHKYTNDDAKAFADAISEPPNGKRGYSMRALSEKLVSEKFPASRGVWTLVFGGRYKIPKDMADRVFELTGYRFPSKYAHEE